MKFYAIYIFCCALYYAEAQYCVGEQLRKVVKTCTEERNATAQDIQDVALLNPSANENAKCFRACLKRECKEMDDEGNLLPNVYMDYMDLLSGGDPSVVESIARVLEHCLKRAHVKGDPCNTTENYLMCIRLNCINCQTEFLAEALSGH